MSDTDPPPSVLPWMRPALVPQPRIVIEIPPLCPECGAEMYEDRGRYDWVCPTRYHAADIENYSGEPDDISEDACEEE